MVISIKGGLRADMAPDGSPENVRRSVDTCLKLLNGKKKLDIFECARGMPGSPYLTFRPMWKCAHGGIMQLCIRTILTSNPS